MSFAVRRTATAVSIHAPARGATRTGAALSGPSCGFDPRSRAGSDRSITKMNLCQTSFDPRSRAGSDLALFNILKQLLKAPGQREPQLT